MGFAADAAIGFLTGIISGWGIGGGTLLMVYLTGFAGMQQHIAQSTNLIYFLPTSAGSLISHIKNRLVDRRVFVAVAAAGTIATAGAALVANYVDSAVLSKLFGLFLLYIGIKEITVKPVRKKDR